MKIRQLIYPVATGLALTLLTTGCDLQYDPIDTYSDVTEGVTEDEEEVVFKDKAAVESYMTSIYKKITDQQEHWYLDQLLIADCHSDNAYVGTTGAEVVPYEDNSIEGSNSVIARDWSRFLEDAAMATKMIQNLDKVQDGSLSQDEQNRYAAQARIFRAMIWFDMVRLWGAVPVITVSAGNITADNVEEMYDAYFPMQNTIEEAYAAIEADLLFGEQYAPEVSSDKTLFTKGVAHAYLAKIYAEKTLRDWDKVIGYADKCAADGYDLVDDFATLWDAPAPGYEPVRDTRESILEGHFFTGAGNWCTWMFGAPVDNPSNNFSWAKWVTPSRDLTALYERNGDTERYNQTVAWYACTWSNYYPADNYAFMYKCRSSYSSIIKCRYADILLLKAEALIMKGDLPSAAEIIDRVRQRAGLAKLTSDKKASQPALLDAYLDERRMELAFEGQRWFDLCRLDKVEEVMNAVYARDPGRHAQRSPYNEFSYLLPIPQGAIDQNSNLVQNPGY